MNIVCIGAGKVGAALAIRLANAGHRVVLARTREGGSSVDAALERSPLLTAAPVLDALADAEVVLLAVPFGAHTTLLPELADALSGKVLVDCTNPVGPGLSHGLHSERSGSELVQALVPGAKVVKAFSIYGFENFEDPAYPGYGVGSAMFFCGDDAAARTTVAQLITDVGFEPLDVGGLNQALHLEHMTLLWVRMVRLHGHDPNMVWGVLRR